MNYPLRVWLFTIIGAPVILFIMTTTGNVHPLREFEQSRSLILPIIILGSMLSLPALFAYYRIYRIVIKLQIHPVSKKIFLLFTGIFLIGATFHVCTESEMYVVDPTPYFLPNYYYVAVLLFTFAFPIDQADLGSSKAQKV